MGVVGAVTMLLAEAFPSFHFEGNHLVALYQFVHDFCFHSCVYSSTCFYLTIAVYEEYFFQFYLIASFAIQVRYVQALALFYLELLTGYLYNCEHKMRFFGAAKVGLLASTTTKNL